MENLPNVILLLLMQGFQSLTLAQSPDYFISTLDHRIDVRIDSKTNVTFLLNGTKELNDSLITIEFNQYPEGILDHVPNRTLNTLETDQFNVTLTGKTAGSTLFNLTKSDDNSTVQINVKDAFLFVKVHHSDFLKVASDVVGWAYFVAWSISFYPQIYENRMRRSVIGLNFDFLSLNLVGFFLYSLFNIGLYAIPAIQGEYFMNHPQGVNPVKLNDVIFSLHAMFACIITIIQCVKYERGGQSVSRPCKYIHIGIGVVLAISLILALAFVMSWLDFLYICSYVKLVITLIKYVPQAYMNYRRKSTMGWSIGNVLLDFTGGLLSILQMFFIAYNYNDWSSIFGDPTKFALGLFSVLFDIFFMLQHYVFYRSVIPHEAILSDHEVEATMSDTQSLDSQD